MESGNNNNQGFIPIHGGYCNLLTYQKAEIIYDGTVYFCNRLVNRLRELNRTPNVNYETFRKAIENPEPEICGNTMITLIKIDSYLLSKQIKTLEMAFINEGGLRGRMT